MSQRQERMERIVGVYQEYQAATIAVDRLAASLRADPASLNPLGLRGRVARVLRDNLEGTYLIRLFAEFEAGLRDAWEKAFHRPTEPPTGDLMDAIAARRFIPRDTLQQAHRVRLFRNRLVHHGETVADRVTIGEARRSLCRYFSMLPEGW